MRAAIHVFATLLLVPYALLAIGFVLLGHVIAGDSLLSIAGRLLDHAAWIVPWGALGACGAIVLVAVLGVLPRSRRLGGLVLGVLAAAALGAIVLLTDGARVGADELLFLLPCALVLAFGTWSYFAESRPDRSGWSR